jgi:3-isopropylmalate/(R)-2-methylmalate dehydratase small subunit
MQPFRAHKGRVSPLYRADVDTDQIIPKQFLKRIEKTGFGEFLFYDWRRTPEGNPDPSFPLNQPRYAGASVLVAGKNFGCGSSREHAVWALEDYGFRVVIAPSFADIFANNCVKNGILTVVLTEEEVGEIIRRATEIPDYEMTVDLEALRVQDRRGFSATFKIDEFTRHCLLEGLDDVGLTLQHEAEIAAYESRHPILQSAKQAFRPQGPASARSSLLQRKW